MQMTALEGTRHSSFLGVPAPPLASFPPVSAPQAPPLGASRCPLAGPRPLGAGCGRIMGPPDTSTSCGGSPCVSFGSSPSPQGTPERHWGLPRPNLLLYRWEEGLCSEDQARHPLSALDSPFPRHITGASSPHSFPLPPRLNFFHLFPPFLLLFGISTYLCSYTGPTSLHNG